MSNSTFCSFRCSNLEVTPPDQPLHEQKRKHRSMLEENPCEKEHDLSLKCLDKNLYNRDKCLQVFENYRKCNDFWNHVYRTRKRQGIIPYMPDIKDRDTVKKQFLSHVT